MRGYILYDADVLLRMRKCGDFICTPTAMNLSVCISLARQPFLGRMGWRARLCVYIFLDQD